MFATHVTYRINGEMITLLLMCSLVCLCSYFFSFASYDDDEYLYWSLFFSFYFIGCVFITLLKRLLEGYWRLCAYWLSNIIFCINSILNTVFSVICLFVVEVGLNRFAPPIG